MKYIYLDWNIFNKIEKLDSLSEDEIKLYTPIRDLIRSGDFLAPYSNAHLNDLIRGYTKNPDYIQGHLDILAQLTKNLCIVQYWKQDKVIWHFRNVYDFFNESVEDEGPIASSFQDLITSSSNFVDDKEVEIDEKFANKILSILSGFIESSDKVIEIDNSKLHKFRALLESSENGIVKVNVFEIMTAINDVTLQSLRSIEVPELDFSDSDPVFEKIFYRTKKERNLLAACEDLFEFSMEIQKDYTLYKPLKKLINQGKQLFKGNSQYLNLINSNEEGPKHLSFDEAIELYAPKTKTSENADYELITNLYSKLDLKGFKSDEKFSNMIDDSLHVFYAAHCDCFITIDDKCYYKATEIYKELGIKTKVIKPTELHDFLEATVS